MRTVVAVSAGEVVRMVAILVLQRAESSGKSVGAVEIHTNDAGLEHINVVLFDSAEEAMAAGREPAAVAPAKAPAQVLQLVTPGAAPEAAVAPSDAS